MSIPIILPARQGHSSSTDQQVFVPIAACAGDTIRQIRALHGCTFILVNSITTRHASKSNRPSNLILAVTFSLPKHIKYCPRINHRTIHLATLFCLFPPSITTPFFQLILIFYTLNFIPFLICRLSLIVFIISFHFLLIRYTYQQWYKNQLSSQDRLVKLTRYLVQFHF